MNINGGFFSYTEGDALREMQRLAGCEVRRCAYPTTKNLTYYISEHGHLFSIQRIQGKLLIRGPKQPGSKHSHGKRKDGGMTLRLSNGKHGKGGESFIRAELLVYCSFCLHRWEPDLQIDFKNGRATDLRPDNLQPKQTEEHPEWTEAMEERKCAYDKEFTRICYSTSFYIGIPIEDSKDIVSQTFVELCTTGNNSSIHNTDEFIGLWHKMSRRRAIDFYHHHGKRFDMEIYDTLLEIKGNRDAPYERDLFHLQPGTKRATYLRMWAEGNTPTEIAKECRCSLSTVSSSISRSIHFLQRYFKKEQGL